MKKGDKILTYWHGKLIEVTIVKVTDSEVEVI